MNPFAIVLLALIYSAGIVSAYQAIDTLRRDRARPARFSTDLDWILPGVAVLVAHTFVVWALVSA